MLKLLFVLTTLTGPATVHATGPSFVTAAEPWVEAARAKWAEIFPGFLGEESAVLDEALLDEVQRMDARIADPVAQLNFRNLLTKIWIVRSRDHLVVYHLRSGSSPRTAYPYYHGIEITPAAARSLAGRVLLLEALHFGFDRVTGFGRRHVPGASWTGVLKMRGRRAAIDFLRDHVPSEVRTRWMRDLIAGGEAGWLDLNVKFYHRLAAAGGESPAPVYAEVFAEPHRRSIECEMGLWRRYDPTRDRERFLK